MASFSARSAVMAVRSAATAASSVLRRSSACFRVAASLVGAHHDLEHLALALIDVGLHGLHLVLHGVEFVIRLHRHRLFLVLLEALLGGGEVLVDGAAGGLVLGDGGLGGVDAGPGGGQPGIEGGDAFGGRGHHALSHPGAGFEFLQVHEAFEVRKHQAQSPIWSSKFKVQSSKVATVDSVDSTPSHFRSVFPGRDGVSRRGPTRLHRLSCDLSNFALLELCTLNVDSPRGVGPPGFEPGTNQL